MSYVPLLIVSRARCLFHSSDVSQIRNLDVGLASFSLLKSSAVSCLHGRHVGHSFLGDSEILNMQY